MALALDPFDIDFADATTRRCVRSEETGRVAMALPPIALCLPTLFGPATFAVSPSRASAPSDGEVAGT